MTIDELQRIFPPCHFGEIKVERAYSYIYDKNNRALLDVIDNGWSFYLDHSCDEWIIGGLEEAKQFSEDLSAAINYVKRAAL